MKRYIKLSLLIAFIWLALFSLLLADSSPRNQACQLASGRHPVMRPDLATLKKWQDSYRRASRAVIDRKNYSLFSLRGNLSLLSHVSYVPAERDQGSCGNCWAWAGTGCLEIALDIQESIKNRLSVQYINSCETSLIGKTRCDGGWLSDVADFYKETKKAVPWSNTNADWHDGDQSYEISCPMVGTSPNYPVDSIDAQTIDTQGVSQATAIADIKNILSQNKGISFGFFLPNQAAWDDFFDFWDNQGETAVYNMDKFNGQIYNSATGAGHAVLCVGYDDTDPNNSYWIMLNSWGTTPGRSNGLFRINMDMNYSSSYYVTDAFYWQNLAVSFNAGSGPVLNSFSMSDRTSSSTEYTRERTVKVSVSYSGGPDEIGFSANSNFSPATWQSFNDSNTYVLPVGDGQKTVYCRVRNSAGESETQSATIYLDSTPPAVNFQLNDKFLKSEDYINSQPTVKAVITEGVGVVESSLKIFRDNIQVSDGLSGGGRYDSFDPATKTLLYNFKNALNGGSHQISFQVTDIAGNTASLSFTSLTVADSLAFSQVVNYPNPFSGSTYFSYQLSQDADINIRIFSSRGQLLKTLSAASGTSGGKLGFNQLAWDGTDAAGALLPNGLYHYLLTAADSSGHRISARGMAGITR